MDKVDGEFESDTIDTDGDSSKYTYGDVDNLEPAIQIRPRSGKPRDNLEEAKVPENSTAIKPDQTKLAKEPLNTVAESSTSSSTPLPKRQKLAKDAYLKKKNGNPAHHEATKIADSTFHSKK
ncbi:hypothetical protein HDU67_010319 [Dinochytrium kinnereticum]|nr:hypothetical protein HDU67_010319 [Dinochytrium kinnereticum]